MKTESEYGKGSAFTAVIPQKAVNGEPAGRFTSVMDQGAGFEAPEASILVADDNELNLDVFKALLERTKVNITAVNSGKACLELVKKEHFHIIFMDHMMPEMDGVETLREIRKLSAFPNENTPVIVLTANTLSGVRELYLKEGFADFLTKPVDAGKLEKMIVSYLPERLVQIREEPPEDVSEDASQKEAFVRLAQEGFNIGAGMQYCRENSEFYQEILVRFSKDAARKTADIEASFQNEDINNYQILVHALKSSAKMIGADGLSELARAAEDAAEKQDSAYITENHGTLIDKYQETARK